MGQLNDSSYSRIKFRLGCAFSASTTYCLLVSQGRCTRACCTLAHACGHISFAYFEHEHAACGHTACAHFERALLISSRVSKTLFWAIPPFQLESTIPAPRAFSPLSFDSWQGILWTPLEAGVGCGGPKSGQFLVTFWGSFWFQNKPQNGTFR